MSTSHTDTIACGGRPSGKRPVVTDAQPQHFSDPPHAQLQQAAVFHRGNAVFDGVLYERLEEERGHQAIECFRRGVECDLEPVCKASVLNRKIAFDHAQLIREGHLFRCATTQSRAQYRVQVRKHVGRFLVAIQIHQRGDGVQAIEQKMRFELSLQYMELCPGQLPLQIELLHCSRIDVELCTDRRCTNIDKSVNCQIDTEPFSDDTSQ